MESRQYYSVADRTRHSPLRDTKAHPSIRSWAVYQRNYRAEDPARLESTRQGVQLSRVEHKIDEIGAMVAAMYGSMGMSGQLPHQIKQNRQRTRPPVGFGRE